MSTRRRDRRKVGPTAKRPTRTLRGHERADWWCDSLTATEEGVSLLVAGVLSMGELTERARGTYADLFADGPAGLLPHEDGLWGWTLGVTLRRMVAERDAVACGANLADLNAAALPAPIVAALAETDPIRFVAEVTASRAAYADEVASRAARHVDAELHALRRAS